MNELQSASISELSLNAIHFDWFEEVELELFGGSISGDDTSPDERIMRTNNPEWSNFPDDYSELTDVELEAGSEQSLPSLQTIESDSENGWESDIESTDDENCLGYSINYMRRPVYPEWQDQASDLGEVPDLQEVSDSEDDGNWCEQSGFAEPNSENEMPPLQDVSDSESESDSEDLCGGTEPTEWGTTLAAVFEDLHLSSTEVYINSDNSTSWYMRDVYRLEWPTIDQVCNSQWNIDLFKLERDQERTYAYVEYENEAYCRAYLFNYLNNDLFGYEVDKPLKVFGDPLAQQVLHILTYVGTFFGDHLMYKSTWGDLEDCFMFYSINDKEYILCDSWWEQLDPDEWELKVNKEWLQNPEFDIVQWYNGLDGRDDSIQWKQCNQMGDPYKWAIEHILDQYQAMMPGDDISIPPEEDPTVHVHFRAARIDTGEEYIIIDKWWNLKFVISHKLLTEP
ncbi:hypothetical protein L218DRAFT_940090 [Marasmius fiardii PR-910]|nr:hypothetical protein L218DRAFT_940090 [Marasmius fiardii PR-910]